MKYIKDYHLDNLFGGTYSFVIDKAKKELTIYTNILDDNATKYFKNTTKFPNKPICVELIGETCKDNLWKTVYPFDKTTTDIVNNIQPDLSDHFAEENLGKKEYHKDNPPKIGDIDYVVPDEKGNIVEVHKCIANDCATNPDSWIKVEDKVVDGGIGAKTGVEIKDISWNFVDGLGDTIEQTHEKVICNATSIGKEVFVVNQNNGLGEFIWVAPNSVSNLQTKIFGDNTKSKRENANNIIGEGVNDLKYEPNNICTSNVKKHE